MKLLFFVFFFIFFIAACGNDGVNNQTIDAGNDLQDEVQTPYPTVSFESKIVPILRNSCILSGCHGENGVTKFVVPAGLSATAEDIETALKNQRAGNGNLFIVPGQPSKSELLVRIFADENAMPPLTTLPIEQQNDLNFWVAQGAGYK